MSPQKFVTIDKVKFYEILQSYRDLRNELFKVFGTYDIISNSKIYEILCADYLGHRIHKKLSGVKDAYDEAGNEYEYKHFKESSSNHSWTFNDFTDNTIAALNKVKNVYFVHINDIDGDPFDIDWYYEVPGEKVGEYLIEHTQVIKNNRKMINLSPNQIETRLHIGKTHTVKKQPGEYAKYINQMKLISGELEKLTNNVGILTSNKFWEILIAVELGHNVNSEQGGRLGAHDAFDENNNSYEYKVSKTYSWQFQDISEAVLNKYLLDEKVILAVVNKDDFLVKDIFIAEPDKIVELLKRKLIERSGRYALRNSEVRRLQVSISRKDLDSIKAIKV